MSEQQSEREALSEVELIERAALRVGMKSLLNHGAASCVYSEGCAGVSQDHLVAFAREVALRCVAALSKPSTEQGWKCPKCGIDRHGPLIACMQEGCPPPPIEPREEKL